jgi:hypothetical protein
MKETHANEIKGETDGADNDDEDGVLDVNGLKESLYGLDDESEAEGEEGDGVDEGTEDLCPLEAVGVCGRGTRVGCQVEGIVGDGNAHHIRELEWYLPCFF